MCFGRSLWAAGKAAAALLLVLPAPALSQETAPPAAGSRVRVQAEGGNQPWLAGELLATPDDSVRLRTGDAAGTVALATPSLARFEVSRGRKSQAGRGAWIGASAGALLGLALGAATYEDCDACLGPDPGVGGSAILGGVLLGVFGLGVGALIGTGIHGERWEPVPRPWSAPQDQSP